MNPATRLRLQQLRKQEEKEPERWWWLSFADDNDGGFLGGVLTRAKGFIQAIDRTIALGINPGGEVLGSPVDDVPEGQQYLQDRLLSKHDIETKMGGAARITHE